jgi:dUTPase
MEKWKGVQKKGMIFTNFINTNTERIVIFSSDRISQVIILINAATSEITDTALL